MIIPIGTDSPVDRRPLANYALIVANVVIFLALSGLRVPSLVSLQGQLLLHGEQPRLYEFFTYQFLHADGIHLFFNMLFLWVFGNSVNARMGHLTYILFYLGGGLFAGLGYAWLNPYPMLGASGAIAAVTTAYLVLFPRSNVSIIYWFIVIGRFEIPSMIIIVLKIILWDNIISPRLAGPTHVAYSAHLAGYAFGFATALLMLALRALPRSHFDILALWRRTYQRRSLARAATDPASQARARYGAMARPVEAADVPSTPPAPEQLDQTDALKLRIAESLSRNDRTTAAQLYQQLLEIDPREVLPRQHQLDVANQLMTLQQHLQAAQAYEMFLHHYSTSPDADQVHLLLGIIYARYLQQYAPAESHLRTALDRLPDPKQRQQCQQWLQVVQSAPSGGQAD